MTNVWAMEIEPKQVFIYELARPGRLFRVEFDLTEAGRAAAGALGPRRGHGHRSMGLPHSLKHAANRILRFSRRHGGHCDTSAPAIQQSQPQHMTQADADAAPVDAAFGYSGLEDEKSIGAMSAEEMSAWENRGIPTVGRISDHAEARADEKQDPTTGLNFPLHWTSARESWDYLFEFSLACELLDPRPDDLVLDFAAGTCWATELLCRLGLRTVSVDMSVEMMRRGRKRLETDSRLVFRDDAAFVAARGQALPFAAGTFDGVLCLNALHHLPSYGVALRESIGS
jgi:hypothetical protein